MDRERGRIGESSIFTGQRYHTLMNLTRGSAVVEALMQPLVDAEGEVALESILHTLSPSMWSSFWGSL